MTGKWEDCCTKAFEEYELDIENHLPNAYGFFDHMGVEGPFDCNGCGTTWVMDENHSEDEDPEFEHLYIPFIGKKGMRYDPVSQQWYRKAEEE